MNKFLIAAAAATALFGSVAQAAPVGLVGGVVGTGTAVLSAPLLTVSNLVQRRASYAGNLAPLGLNFAVTIVPILIAKNGNVPSTVETLSIPLPGPDFLNMNLVNVPGRVQVNVQAAGPVVVTYKTGQ